MTEQRVNSNSRKMTVAIVVLSILLAALIVISVFVLLDRNTVVKNNDEMTAKVEELQTQISTNSGKLNAMDATIADLQSALETAKASNDALTTVNEDLQAQAADGTEKLAASGTTITNLQSELETAQAEVVTQLDALQNEFDTYKETADAAMEDLQQKYETDMALAADTLEKAQEEATQAQNELIAKIDELTSEIALLTQTPEPDVTEFEADVVEVSDAVSFLAAIRPNRTIYLLPGDYDLSSDAVMELLTGVNPTQLPYVYYNDFETNDMLNSGVVIANVYDLTIVANSPQEIYTKDTQDTVLIFESCKYITVSGITFGHKPNQATACVAAVIGTAYCNDMVFSGCDLYGCGVEGAYLEYSSSITFLDSIIRDCTYMAAYVYDGTDIQFIGTEIYGVGTSSKFAQTLFQISGNSKAITFKECNIHDNGNNTGTTPTAMFLVSGREDELTITDCEMNNNLYDHYIR